MFKNFTIIVLFLIDKQDIDLVLLSDKHNLETYFEIRAVYIRAKFGC